jgi:hypothetical protein
VRAYSTQHTLLDVRCISAIGTSTYSGPKCHLGRCG